MSFPVLNRIKPQAPLLVVPAQTSSETGTTLIAVTLAQAMELAKNVKTHGNNRQNGSTRKQQQTTTLSEPTSVDIDAIDTDMNARAGDAELIPWLSWSWIVHHSTLRRNYAASHTSNDTSNYAACSGTSQHAHSRWTERTCERSRARSAASWPNTSPSSSWKPSPTSNVSIWNPAHRCSDSCCSHSCAQQHRTQTARNIELLALHRLERAGAARASNRSKTSSGDGRTLFTRHSRRASRARCRSRSH